MIKVVNSWIPKKHHLSNIKASDSTGTPLIIYVNWKAIPNIWTIWSRPGMSGNKKRSVRNWLHKVWHMIRAWSGSNIWLGNRLTLDWWRNQWAYLAWTDEHRLLGMWCSWIRWGWGATKAREANSYTWKLCSASKNLVIGLTAMQYLIEWCWRKKRLYMKGNELRKYRPHHRVVIDTYSNVSSTLETFLLQASD